MSTFLGPIHHWLFNKINLVEDREKTLLDVFAKKYGDGPERLGKELYRKYGPHFDNTPLENLMGENPIHAFLAESIERVETREAAFLKALIDSYGSDAETLALDISCRHGQKNGKKAKGEYQTVDPTPEDVYKILRNFLLDGMPCDHVVEVEQHSDRVFIERHTDCLHKAYWKNAGIPEGFMCDYLCKWMDGFVEAMGGRVKHSRPRAIAKGAPICEDVFERK